MRKIAVFFPYGHLDTVASIKALITKFSLDGYKIDVFTIFDINYSKPIIKHHNTKIFFMPKKQKKRKQNTLFVMFLFLIWVIKFFLRNKYLFILGVGVRGLLLSFLIGKNFKTPYIYYSLELYIKKDLKGLQRKLKFLEKLCCQYADYTIAQDNLRAKLFANDNDISLEKILIFPNSPLGEVSLKKSDYIYEKFGIDKEKTIILYAGSLEPWAMTLELVECAQSWPLNWVLILHSRRRPFDNYLKKLYEADYKKRVVFSLTPVNEIKLEKIVASADIGIVLMRNNTANHYFMGLSSGKLALYLKFGLPVIVSESPLIKELLEEFCCGEAVKELDEIKDKIKKIMKNYNKYKYGCISCFNEIFKLDNYYNILKIKINEIF